MKRYFCTCFDHNYLVYGLTLFESLKKYVPDFQLFVLCLSDKVYEQLTDLAPQITPVSLTELENTYPELLACKNNRSKAEYIFTLSPVLPLLLFKKYGYIDLLAYLDSDLLFFASPEFLFEQMKDHSLYITRHRFTIDTEEREFKYGKYNVAFQIYRNDPVGNFCLNQWKTQCVSWCYDRAEDGKFADQKYLDSWPEQWKDAVVIGNQPGINSALWNMGNTGYSARNGQLYLDQYKLIFFHYQGFKILSQYLALWPQEDYVCSDHTVRYLAKLYFNSLKETIKKYPVFFSGKFVVPERFYQERLKFTRMEKYISLVPFRRVQFAIRILYFYLRNSQSVFFNF